MTPFFTTGFNFKIILTFIFSASTQLYCKVLTLRLSLQCITIIYSLRTQSDSALSFTGDWQNYYFAFNIVIPVENNRLFEVHVQREFIIIQIGAKTKKKTGDYSRMNLGISLIIIVLNVMLTEDF